MRADSRPAAFVDRDGVINQELDHVHRVEDFHLLPGAVQGLSTLAECGYELIVVTNQAGIAKGLYDEADYQQLAHHMRSLLLARGVTLGGIYHCPHHPDGVVPSLSVQCDCRKPAPGMLLRAAREHHLDLSQSVIVGDKLSDISAGRAAGVALAVLVDSGHPVSPDAALAADHCSADLAAAARWICGRIRSP